MVWFLSLWVLEFCSCWCWVLVRCCPGFSFRCLGLSFLHCAFVGDGVGSLALMFLPLSWCGEGWLLGLMFFPLFRCGEGVTAWPYAPPVILVWGRDDFLSLYSSLYPGVGMVVLAWPFAWWGWWWGGTLLVVYMVVSGTARIRINPGDAWSSGLSGRHKCSANLAQHQRTQLCWTGEKKKEKYTSEAHRGKRGYTSKKSQHNDIDRKYANVKPRGAQPNAPHT